MAQTADVVGIEVEARLNQAKAAAAAAEFDQTVNKMSASAGKAEQAISQASEKMGNAFGTAGARSRQLGIQIGQLGSSVASGMNPMVVAAQQASDFAYVLGGTTGVAGRLATFFSGPWGAALLAAGLTAGVFASKIKIGNSELDDATDKLRKNAAQTEVTDRAKAIFANTMEGLTQAVRENKKAVDELNDADKTAAQRAFEASYATLERLKTQRAEIAANLSLAQSLLEVQKARASSPSQRGEIAALGLESRSSTLSALQTQLATIDRLIATSEQSVRGAQAAFVADVVSNLSDPIERIHAQADNAVKREIELVKQTNLVGDALNAEIAKRTQIIRLQEQAAVKAEQERQRKKKEVDTDLTAFQRPVSGGRISGQFGETRPGHQHGGVDIAVPVGTRVGAAAGGVVIEAGTLPGYGNVVIIDHGRGTVSRYAHLSQISATRGQVVDAGDLLGLSGGARGAPGAGNSQGAHLHFEVRQGGRPVNPFGTHPTDPLSSAQRSQQIAERLEREHQKELAQTARFNAESERINEAINDARAPLVPTAEEALAAAQADLAAERDKSNASYQAAADQQQITQTQADLLVEANNRLFIAKSLHLVEQDEERRAKLAAQLNEEYFAEQVQRAQFEADNTKTADEHRQALLRVLNAEQALERIKLQQIIDATAAGTAEHDLAVLRMSQLDAERARRTFSINNDPANLSPGQRYRQSLNQTAGQIDEALDEITVDGLTKLNDELTQAIMGTQSLGETFDHVAEQIISALIKIAIQQAIIKPLADLLFGPGATGTATAGGGGGGFLASFLGSLIPRASGGPVKAGQGYWVGEDGPEPFIPSQNGTIIPNQDVVRMGSDGGSTQLVNNFTVNAPGATAETVAMIQRELRAFAPTIVAASQRVTVKGLLRTRT